MTLELFTNFVNTHGWQLAAIAFAGVVLLGVLKYANAFAKVEKEKRKPIYFGISIGFSLIGTIVYLLVIGQFDWSYLVAVTTAVYALNQTMYSVYETTTLRDLVIKIVEYVINKVKQKPQEKAEEKVEETVE